MERRRRLPPIVVDALIAAAVFALGLTSLVLLTPAGQLATTRAVAELWLGRRPDASRAWTEAVGAWPGYTRALLWMTAAIGGALAAAQGVKVQVFGQSRDNARAYWNWQFLPEMPELPQTRALLMRAWARLWG